MRKTRLMLAGMEFLRDLADDPGWSFMIEGKASGSRAQAVMAECRGSWVELRSPDRETMELSTGIGNARARVVYTENTRTKESIPREPEILTDNPETADLMTRRILRYMADIEAYARNEEKYFRWEKR